MQEASGQREKRLSIALLIDVALAYYQMNIILGAVEAARSNGINLYCIEGGALSTLPNTVNRSNLLYELLSPQEIDGVLLLSSLFNFAESKQASDFARRFSPLPTVSIACRIEGCSSIIVDNQNGIREMIRHLVEIHHYKKFAVILGPEREGNSSERYETIRNSLDDYGIPLDMRRVVQGDFLMSSGIEAVKILIDQRKVDFDAILAMNDGMAWGALQELHSRGIKVPQEIAVAGFDNFFASVFSSPPLTTVNPSLFEQGKKAVELLKEMILHRSSQCEIVIPTKLVLRESCGCFPQVSSRQRTEELKLADPPVYFLDKHRENMKNEVVVEIGLIYGNLPSLSLLVEKMIDAIYPISDVENREFIQTCYEILRHNIRNDQDASLWQNVLTEIRRSFLVRISDYKTLVDAEDIFHQMRIVIAEMAIVTEKISKHNSAENSQVLNAISEKLLSSMDLEQITLVLSKELPQLGITSGFITTIGKNGPNGIERRLRLCFNEHGRIRLKSSDERYEGLVPDKLLADDQPHALMVSFLSFGGKRTGFMGLEINTQDAGVYDALHRIVASSISGALMTKTLKKQEKDLVAQREHLKNMAEMRKAMEGFILTLLRTFELKDPYTAGHQGRVAKLARGIALEMGLSPEIAEGLLMAGYLHDIGKISVPTEVLVKPVRLDEVEFALIRGHAKTAFDILKKIDFPWPISMPIMQHHERLNGSGYPDQLRNEEICLEAKILAVADVIEAMASHRPYRPALGIKEALREIILNRGILYDPGVVDACVRLFKEKGYRLD